MLPSLITLLAETEEPRAALILPNWAFPLIAAIIFVVIAFITWSFRDVAHRHAEKLDDAPAQHHDSGHGGH